MAFPWFPWLSGGPCSPGLSEVAEVQIGGHARPMHSHASKACTIFFEYKIVQSLHLNTSTYMRDKFCPLGTVMCSQHATYHVWDTSPLFIQCLSKNL